MGYTGSGDVDTTSGELDAALRDIVGAAQRASPAFRIPSDVFAAYLRERLPRDVPPPVALRQMHTSDLYLACACAHGNAQALAAFEARCLSHLDRVLGKMGIKTDVIAEVKQSIRSRVLVGDGGPAEIVDFRGRGDLRGWVRVMAARQALRYERRSRREATMEDEELLQQMVAPENPELDYMKGFYRQRFKRAFEGALRALPDREQTLLRQHYVDSLTLDELASLYRIHRSTVARLLAHARGMVLEATREQLVSQLGVPSQDLDSILRTIWSQLEITLRGLRRGRKR
jgi:RNA polymerase sigma-70 factor (ECF subfamily)